MRSRFRIGSVILIIAVLGAVAWEVLRPAAEPVYNGKSLSAWLEAYDNSTHSLDSLGRSRADEAIHAMGTNALPGLLRILRSRDSALTLKLLALARKQHLMKIKYTTAGSRKWEAMEAFRVLGPVGREAVPDLTALADTEPVRPDGFTFSARALGLIGPDAAAATPVLLRQANGTNNPAVAGSLDEPFVALFRIHSAPELVVPAMTRILQDTNCKSRWEAALVLGNFKAEAKSAVPALIQSLASTDAELRASATKALKQISPEAAAQAGIK